MKCKTLLSQKKMQRSTFFLSLSFYVKDILTLKVSIMTAPDIKFCEIYFHFQGI